MKKFILLAGVVFLMTSCALETYQCPSYSQTNKTTKHGEKAQAKYARKKI